MTTLDQQRAALAYEHVRAVAAQEEASQKKYASIVYALPALLRSAGLSQALHFVLSRKEESQKLLLEHLAAQLTRVDPTINKDSAKLLDRARRAELDAYLHLTREALACAGWYRRFVQGELGIELGSETAQ